MSIDHSKTIEALTLEIDRLRAALQKIHTWFGEFPPTGKFWEDGKPMSYGSYYGSNGERDYMRSIALEALSAITTREENDRT